MYFMLRQVGETAASLLLGTREEWNSLPLYQRMLFCLTGRGKGERGFDLTCVAGSYEIIRVEFCRARVWFPIERPVMVSGYIMSVNSVRTYIRFLCWGRICWLCVLGNKRKNVQWNKNWERHAWKDILFRKDIHSRIFKKFVIDEWRLL